MSAKSPILPVYAPWPVSFTHGEGCYLFDTEGKRYLDCGAGVAVSCLGHGHPALVNALTEQASKLWHCSNWYTIPEQERAAQLLVDNSFADYVFFTNSGAESMEAAIKIARRRHLDAGKYRIITCQRAFHGRTLTEVAAMGGDQFGPVMPGFDRVPYGDLEALEAVITKETTAVLLEPVQGEGGIHPASLDYLKQVRALTEQHNLSLIFDEIQTGIGRTGKLFAHEWAGITPDILASAKGLGGGFPVGAVLTTVDAASGMKPGLHGSTYGGNPLASRVVEAVLTEILAPAFLPRVDAIARQLWHALLDLVEKFPAVFTNVRGAGLMLGLQCNGQNIEIAKELCNQGLLVIPAGDNVVRLLPPLIFGEAELNHCMEILHAYASSSS